MLLLTASARSRACGESMAVYIKLLMNLQFPKITMCVYFDWSTLKKQYLCGV